MMRILHSAAMMTPSRGQLTQMTWEQQAAENVGLAWDSRFFCPRDSTKPSAIVQYSDVVSFQDLKSLTQKIRSWFKFRRSYYDWLGCVQDSYDVLLLRYNFHDPYQLAFVRKAKCPVYFVHHTLEVPELFSSHTLMGMVRGVADSFLGPATLRAATGTIGVTDEIARYEYERTGRACLRTAVFPNGVEYSDDVVLDERQGLPKLLYVAGTFAVWHGLDLLLSALRESKEELTLHLIGQLSEHEHRLAARDPRVRLHGSMPRESIRKIAALCDIGLSTFALQRKKMYQACTLKVRDYLTMGLPVYAGYDDVFPSAFQYYVNGPVSIEAIVKYAKSMRSVSRQVVADAARPYIDKGVLMKDLLKSLSTEMTPK
ncbi:hypothetical protein QMK61_04790 [Fulvimonas sp. R45]|uniref:hypothetical protein n=1 Tax=Fulvimonas sp. R45 TaxID=3045937 RepID=UPI00265EDB56|nr:hypothetical protein [Fulvimonas sp. R45]MDO1528145.1 hypothetical protein [Fulvimonas sp. R45]